MNPYYTKRDEYGNYQKIIERKSLGPGNGSKTITNRCTIHSSNIRIIPRISMSLAQFLIGILLYVKTCG